jgi:hypothetical protein
MRKPGSFSLHHTREAVATLGCLAPALRREIEELLVAVLELVERSPPPDAEKLTNRLTAGTLQLEYEVSPTARMVTVLRINIQNE